MMTKQELMRQLNAAAETGDREAIHRLIDALAIEDAKIELDAMPEPRAGDSAQTRAMRVEKRTQLLARIHNIRESNAEGYDSYQLRNVFCAPVTAKESK